MPTNYIKCPQITSYAHNLYFMPTICIKWSQMSKNYIKCPQFKIKCPLIKWIAHNWYVLKNNDQWKTTTIIGRNCQITDRIWSKKISRRNVSKHQRSVKAWRSVWFIFVGMKSSVSIKCNLWTFNTIVGISCNFEFILC